MGKKKTAGAEQVQEFVDTMISEVKTETKVKNPSGNVPYRHKFYGLNRDEFTRLEVDGELKKLPGQVQGLLKFLASKSDGYEDIGPVICAGAIEGDFLKTKIDPATLFAYYRKTMEQTGALVFKGYKLWNKGDSLKKAKKKTKKVEQTEQVAA